MRSTNDIRHAFIDYFVSKGHRHVPSSSLVGDASLLFTNSGMVQFKDTFLGAEKRDYTRAASSQRCVRAGGKHNDLDQVGYTARHHTFFEMLGNFSFGDYFKRDAIHYAWELLTEVYGLPKEKLWVTVYHNDDEAYGYWNSEIGVPAERIVRIGDNKGAPFASDNFWQMADTGPCGPCSEIFFDHGPGVAGGPPGSPDADGDRYIEIWNLVFMQFDRSVLGSREFASETDARAAYEAALASGKVVNPPVPQRLPSGELKHVLTEYKMAPLPKPCVDTGMGLERLTAVLQHVHSNYEIDLFQALIKRAAELTGCADIAEPSLRVIADHIRATSFLIVDGVLPSNEGRGYVLRRIIRRALRHGWKLGTRGAFFHKMVGALVEQMGKAYPELASRASLVEQVLEGEEERFSETLDKGMKRLYSFMSEIVAWYVQDQIGSSDVVGPGFSGQVFFDAMVGDPNNYHTGYFNLTRIGMDRTEAGIVAVREQRESWPNSFRKIVVWIEPDMPGFEEAVGRIRTIDTGVEGPEIEILVPSIDDLRRLRVIVGRAAFAFYDTYGFPLDLTADVCRELGWTVDEDGFQDELNRQRQTARAASSFGSGLKITAEHVEGVAPTEFLGYEQHAATGNIVRMLVDGQVRQSARDGETAIVLLDRTPFYAESGGQVGDHGELSSERGAARVRDTIKIAGVFHGHVVEVAQGTLNVGDTMQARIDSTRRSATVLNHSATHLLHAVLRSELGDHVQQKGSLVAPDRLRFDFSHFEPISPEQLARIEAKVNHDIRANAQAEVHQMAMKEALDFGALALFGEKYGERVRVLRMGEFSTELCGGTHVSRTGDIGLFKILSEGGISAGVRRIEAITGDAAVAFVQEQEQRLRELSSMLGGGDQVLVKVQQLLDRVKQGERELGQLKAKAASASLDDLIASAIDIDGVKLLSVRLEGIDAKVLRQMLDTLKQKLVDAVVVLASVADGKATLIAGVSGSALGRVKAGDVLGFVASKAGGKGGGRPDMAQGGANDGPALTAALAEVQQFVGAQFA